MLRKVFKLENPIVGMTLNSARGGESASILPRGFFTSDDGPILYTYLDSLFDCFLSRVIASREQVRSAFIAIANRTDVTVLVNPDLQLSIVPKGDVKAGAPVFLDHVADISEARIPGYDFPNAGAIAYVFEHGWRRGLFFDFTANLPEFPSDKPLGNVAALLGSLHAALMLRDRIRMEPAVLKKMALAGWFPFSRLSTKHTLDLYRHFENDWEAAEPVAEILKEHGPRIADMVESWASKPVFQPHIDTLRNASRLYAQGEYSAAASMLLPKVEGVLRHVYTGTNDRPNAPELRAGLLGRVRASVEGYTALLPETFIQYLEDYYYAGFNFREGKLPASRNSFLHGVGPDEQLKDPTYALRLFFTLDQLFFCLSRMKAVP
jgi:hypothetical protein